MAEADRYVFPAPGGPCTNRWVSSRASIAAIAAGTVSAPAGMTGAPTFRPRIRGNSPFNADVTARYWPPSAITASAYRLTASGERHCPGAEPVSGTASQRTQRERPQLELNFAGLLIEVTISPAGSRAVPRAAALPLRILKSWAGNVNVCTIERFSGNGGSTDVALSPRCIRHRPAAPRGELGAP